MLPTHVHIDGKLHKIANVEEHADGPAHTHRVHLGCGTTIDVDIGGVKAHARWKERAETVLRERNHDLHREHSAKAVEALAKGETWQHDRWRHHGDEKVADCANCSAHENGTEAIVHPLYHNPAKTVESDIPTAVSCPQCGYKIYKRRREEIYACSGQGHEYTLVDLMNHLKEAFGTLAATVESK